MAFQCEGKNSWPELVGVQGEVAAKKVEQENPNVDAIIVEDGTGVPEDFRCTRVWVWVDKYGLVVRTPQIG